MIAATLIRLVGALALVATVLTGCGAPGPSLAATTIVSPSGVPSTESATSPSAAPTAGSPATTPMTTPGTTSGTPGAAAAGPTPTESSEPTGGGRLPGEPDPGLTPGAIDRTVTQANIATTICKAGYSKTVRPPSSYTTALKRRQIDEYGYRDHVLADYEEDHLISLELGGSPRDPANLWPEPYTVNLSDGRSVGARVKDKIENRLHAMVCARTIGLAAAQREIATDWVRAWFALDGEPPPPPNG